MNAFSTPIEIALDETGLPEGQIMADSIRQRRSDCQAGQFKIGASAMRGPRLVSSSIRAKGNWVSERERMSASTRLPGISTGRSCRPRPPAT